MNQADQLNAIQDYVYTIFNDDVTGHDFFHMERVARMANNLAIREQADPFICEAAAWLHDIGDRKLFSVRNQAIHKMDTFLQSICTNKEISAIKTAVQDVSFNGGRIPDTLEGKIVQDADRLDAIGAIGIARTFAYGAANGQLLWHDQEGNQRNTSIQHFYDKLLLLKDLMNTAAAKKVADKRHRFMEAYLEQFFAEWQ
ncbi:uncharacterized protein SAMN04488072_101361 [Lentibacillus halodurans]|uniref:HD/PDEase domain-containing protein n=1 Tax=Lentibacillus halodurans TaxID=237679 RepID=A0A1I0VEX4_9BACI|nr:HD domain-containing protein [Lentibacillus halodurans]SFA74597.1 uncharacterized protein SAMN04488072_101361 [Lentibacillus halodurans]